MRFNPRVWTPIAQVLAAVNVAALFGGTILIPKRIADASLQEYLRFRRIEQRLHKRKASLKLFLLLNCQFLLFFL